MKYFLTGIKGSGMTALACVLKDMGHEVLGSDVESVFFTDAKLIEKEIPFTTFNENNINETIDTLILGNAFSDEHEEVLKAKKLGIKVIRYYAYLSMLAKEHNSVAIAGTNGKTTTTGLVSAMLRDEDPIYLIGDGTGSAKAESSTFIFEACEYKNTFLNYQPKFGLINNIEFDHPDFFKDLDHVIETYQKFANVCDIVILNNDDENVCKITADKTISFGVKNQADIMMENIEKSAAGFSFDLIIKGVNYGNYKLPFAGDHMVLNALASIAIAYALDKDIDDAISNLATFSGVKRRFEIEVLDETNNIVMIDDYAHHPTAIELTIDAICQKYPNCTVSVLFQPHTFSRTEAFLTEFAESLAKADNVYLADIFGSVRESVGEIGIESLIAATNNLGKEVKRDLQFISEIKENHIIAVLGAGNIDKLYKDKIRKIIGS